MHSSAKSKIISRWMHQYSESKLHRNLGCSQEESNCDVNKNHKSKAQRHAVDPERWDGAGSRVVARPRPTRPPRPWLWLRWPRHGARRAALGEVGAEPPHRRPGEGRRAALQVEAAARLHGSRRVSSGVGEGLLIARSWGAVGRGRWVCTAARGRRSSGSVPRSSMPLWPARPHAHLHGSSRGWWGGRRRGGGWSPKSSSGWGSRRVRLRVGEAVGRRAVGGSSHEGKRVPPSRPCWRGRERH